MTSRFHPLGLGWLAPLAVAASLLSACGGPDLPPSVLSSDNPAPPADVAPALSTAPERSVTIDVDAASPSEPFDRRLLGTNLPAWLGPERLADPAFRDATLRSGTTLLRMPGGSWSNSYSWSACEIGDAEECVFADAARPSDFIGFMKGTGLPGMWTVSVNETAQSAAAAVAFFNGDIDDDSVIGVDRNGRDWGTVSLWAGLRAEGGHSEPAPVRLWEVGNEVYGGKPESGGALCASFGWEDVWTCDGTAYMIGDDQHDGYLAIRQAMLAVDPAIEVGAVGVSEPSAWSDWGNKVIAAGAGEMDFYVVHQYGFDESPTAQSALARPSSMWADTVSAVRGALGDTTPIAVTEYNLVAFEGGDGERTMTENMNALFVADTIGQLAELGVSVANQWNLANGTTGSGTDYGMIRLEDRSTTPQYEAMRLWSGAGSELLEALSSDEMVHAYPTRHDDGSVTLLVVNLNEGATSATIGLDGASLGPVAQVTGVSTDDLEAPMMTVLDETSADVIDGSFSVDLPGWSIVAIEVPSDD
jgi:hypothetical protein